MVWLCGLCGLVDRRCVKQLGEEQSTNLLLEVSGETYTTSETLDFLHLLRNAGQESIPKLS